MPSSMDRIDASVARSASVSSMRNTNVPPLPRACSQLYSAVRTEPTWSHPDGAGAKRTRGADTGTSEGQGTPDDATEGATRSPGRVRCATASRCVAVLPRPRLGDDRVTL